MRVGDKYQLRSLELNETHFLFRGLVHNYHSNLYAVRKSHPAEMHGKRFQAEESRSGVIIRRTV